VTLQRGTEMIWYDTVGGVPIRVGIPHDLTATEAKAVLEEFVGFLGELAKLPHADKRTIGEAYRIVKNKDNKYY
jgi:hypothetical protein